MTLTFPLLRGQQRLTSFPSGEGFRAQTSRCDSTMLTPLEAKETCSYCTRQRQCVDTSFSIYSKEGFPVPGPLLQLITSFVCSSQALACAACCLLIPRAPPPPQ